MESTTTALAVVASNETGVATFDRAQLDLIKRTVANGTSDDEFALFIEVCKRTGLDPFSHQIYAIMRSSGKDSHGQWQKRMTIQTGIDGYRALASRTRALAGIDDAQYDTEDGEHPRWARVTVYRWSHGQRCAFTATARWAEYAQYTVKDGQRILTGKWTDMPWLMLGKCAEALALRKAFPVQISGVYTAEEMMQADNPPIVESTIVTPADAPATTAAAASAQRLAAKTPAPAQPLPTWNGGIRIAALEAGYKSDDEYVAMLRRVTGKSDKRQYTDADKRLVLDFLADVPQADEANASAVVEATA